MHRLIFRIRIGIEKPKPGGLLAVSNFRLTIFCVSFRGRRKARPQLFVPADERDYDCTDYSLSQVGTHIFIVLCCVRVCPPLSAAAEALTVRVTSLV